MADSSDRFVFAPFELDLPNCELRRDGAVVKLAPQPFTALVLLVSRAGTLVTREELRVAIWGADRHVDFDGGLNFCISQLREALGDPASESKFIAAVPRRGYRFVAAVERPASRVEGPGRRWGNRTAVAACAVCVAIAAIVAVALWMRGDAGPLSRARSLNALQYYERGSSGLADASPRELLDRVTFFERAISEEPDYAEAYAGLAGAKLLLGNYRAIAPQVAYASAKAAAARSLSLDPGLGDAHAAFAAAVMYFEWDWAAAREHLDRAVALAPDSAMVHYWFARYLSATGQHHRAIEHAQRTVQLSPTSPSAHTLLGMTQFYAGRFANAVADCDMAGSLMREFEPAFMCRRTAAAEAESQPDFWRARLKRLLDSSSDEERMLNAVAIASAHAHIGERDAALEWLERASNYRADVLIFAAVHPALQPLRGEQRYARVLQRIGLS